MVNETSKPIIVYGMKLEDHFFPTGYMLRLSQDTCKWKYPTGDDAPLKWSERSPSDKGEYLLPSGQSIEFDAVFNDWEVSRPFKRTAYVSFQNANEPCEVSSEGFVLEEEKTQQRSISVAALLSSCTPKCTLMLDHVPEFYGIKLGMNLEQLKARFPDIQFSKTLDSGVRESHLLIPSNSPYQSALPNVFLIEMVFVNERLGRLIVKFWDVDKWKSRDEFVKQMAETLGLSDRWSPSNSSFECNDFQITAWEDSSKSIRFDDKAAKPIIDKAISDSYMKER